MKKIAIAIVMGIILSSCSFFNNNNDGPVVIRKKIQLMQETTDKKFEELNDRIDALEKKVDDITIQIKEIKEVKKVEAKIDNGETIAQTFKTTVYFDFDSAEISDAANSEILRVIGIMKQYSILRVSLDGYADPVGTDEYNIELSKKRAEKVQDVFTKNGISTYKIKTEGHGETNLISDIDQFNRRVEITFIH